MWRGFISDARGQLLCPWLRIVQTIERNRNLLTMVPSIIFFVFTQKKEGDKGPLGPALDPPVYFIGLNLQTVMWQYSSSLLHNFAGLSKHMHTHIRSGF